MKLIINISDESYDKALNGIINCKECFDAIVYGTPIPDNATNGDVIKAMFPNTTFGGNKTEINIGTYWWNAPYNPHINNKPNVCDTNPFNDERFGG